MRILVLGEVAGGPRGSSADRLPRAEGIQRVDIDHFDRLMASIEPSVQLAFEDPAEEPVRLSFRSLEEFHPDRLSEQDPVLARLRALKGQLQDPAAFAAAAAALGAVLGPGDAQRRPSAAQPIQSPETDAQTLERLLGSRTDSAQGPTPASTGPVEEMIRRLVRPLVTPETPDPGPYLAAADAAAGSRLRHLLHHPDLQKLEALWRSLHGLVSQLEADDLEISVLGVDWPTLRPDAADGGDGQRSALREALRASAARGLDDDGWTLIVADYAFGPAETDLGLLAGLGAAASELGALLLAGAKPELVGCPDLVTYPDPREWSPGSGEAFRHWRTLRESACGGSIGLALPRILLRLPYGRASDPCDLFPFEEMPDPPVHSRFLWGNPAFLCTLVLAQAHIGGFDFPPYGEVGDLPAYVFRRGDEMEMQPCAEVYLSEAAGQAIEAAGCIPVHTYLRRSAVRLGPIKTLAT